MNVGGVGNPDRVGTAEWMDPDEFAEQFAFTDGKFWLGRGPLHGEQIGYLDDRHVCLVSGSRSGKGTTVIIPNLCLWPGSVVVVDPKGENATVTAARRGSGSKHCTGLGQVVHVLDPFHEAQVDDALRSRFNPMDALNPDDPEVTEEVSRIAESLVVVTEGTEAASWERSARTMVKGLILHVLTDPRFEGRRNLITVRKLLARGDYETLEQLRGMDVDDLPSAQALLWEGMSRNRALGGVIAGIGDQFADQYNKAPKQFVGAHGPAIENTEFLDSPKMRECLTHSDFQISDLKTNPKGMSLFLALPQRHMDRHFRWLRLMVSLITSEMQAARGRPASGHPVLMCLDEFAGLKRMEVIENAVAQIAGYGVKLFFVLQTLEQLKAVYRDNWETFLSNSGTKIFFGLDDHFSRDYVSRFIGETELIREVQSRSTNEQRNTQTTTSSSWQEGSQWGKSKGRACGGVWRQDPFLLRNTSRLLPLLRRGEGANESLQTGSNIGGSRSTGGSEAEAAGTARGTTDGTSQTIHKRSLATPDEIGRFFSRVDDVQSLAYPGLAIVLISGHHSGIVRRTHYFSDRKFAGLFDPHSDHEFDPDAWKSGPPLSVFQLPLPPQRFVKGWSVFGVNTEDQIASRIHFITDGWPGNVVKKGQHIGFFMTYSPNINDAPIYAPLDGKVRSILHQGGRQGPPARVENDHDAVMEIEVDQRTRVTNEHLETAYGGLVGKGRAFYWQGIAGLFMLIFMCVCLGIIHMILEAIGCDVG